MPPLNRRFRWEKALHRSDLNPTAHHVGLAMATYMDTDGTTWVSRLSIARDTGLNLRTVSRGLKDLRDAELLYVVSHRHNSSAVYRARFPSGAPDEDTTLDLGVGPDTSVPLTTREQPESSPGGSPPPEDWCVACWDCGNDAGVVHRREVWPEEAAVFDAMTPNAGGRYRITGYRCPRCAG